MSSSSAFITGGGGAGSVSSLDGDTGSAGPVAGVITIAGSGGVTTAGAGSTVTISFAGGTNGQLLTGSTGTDAVFADPTSADNSIEFTGGAGTLDLSYTGTITTNAQLGSYQLVLADRGKLITIDNIAATNLTVPPNSTEAFPVGASILATQLGAGAITVVPGAGVTLISRLNLLDTAGQYAMITLVKILSDTWQVAGDRA